MAVMNFIRRHSSKLARANAALFGLVWLSIVAAPCVMAMHMEQAAGSQGCPHCPPAPCIEVQPDDCDGLDSLDAFRLAEQVKTISFGVPVPAPETDVARLQVRMHEFASVPPARAGPRVHLLYVQFNE